MVGPFSVPISGRVEEGFPCPVYRLGDASALTCIYCNTGPAYMNWNADLNRIKTAYGFCAYVTGGCHLEFPFHPSKPPLSLMFSRVTVSFLSYVTL